MTWLFLALACKRAPPADPADALGVLPCATLAAGDACVETACQECVDFCGLGCESVQDDPLGFTCPGVGSFTVAQVCPATPPDVAEPEEGG